MRGMSAVLLLLLVVIVNFALQPLTEPDFGWHLRTGLDLLHHQLSLPDTDPYSHTMPDWTWVEHAWLTDVLIASLYMLFGGLGVLVFFSIVTVAAWLIGAGVSSAGPACRWVACTLSLWVALPYLGARTQLVTLLGLALLLWILKRWQDSNNSLSWWIPPLFLLWANLHGGFVVGLMVLGLLIVVTSILRSLSERRIVFGGHSHERLFSKDELKRLVLLAAASACLTLLNPYGWRLHGEILDSLSNRFMLETLQEWQPLTISTLAGRRYVLYLACLGIGMAFWYRSIEPVQWAIGVVFLAFSVRHMRNIPFFLIWSLPFLADVLVQTFQRSCRRWPLSDTWAKTAELAAAGLLAGLLWWLGPEHVHRVALSGIRPAEFFRSTSYPIEAVQWVTAHQEQAGKRLYNDYGYGGFLLWWLPGTKIFIDGRMPAWQRGQRDILRDYLALTGETPDMSVLAKYSVDWALVKRHTPLEEGLARSAAWSRVYDDEKAAIYRLNTTMPAF
jgi:hypothetical protein